MGSWDNFLLACANCNSTKLDKVVDPSAVYLPDRDNTYAAFEYLADGTIRSRTQGDELAGRTLALVGLDKPLHAFHDENGRFVATDRVGDRMTVWGIALESRMELNAYPTDGMRKVVVNNALGHGFFSIWMEVFARDPATRRLLVEAFRGTAVDCFNDAMSAISPRRPNGLDSSGKI